MEVMARAASRAAPTCGWSTSRTSRRTTRETLRRWRERLRGRAPTSSTQLGYDERFRRLWRLYLRYCEAGFTERRIGELQVVLAKPRYRPVSAPRLAAEHPRADRVEEERWAA